MFSWWRIRRIWVHGWHNASRNIWLSLATGVVGVMALFSVALLLTIGVLSDYTIQNLKDRVNLTLYFKPEVAAERVRILGQELAKQPLVASVRFISPEVALSRFKERHSADQEVMEGLEAVGGNPFGSSLIVQTKSERDYEAIINLVRDEPFRSLLQQNDEEFQDYAGIIQKFSNLTRQVNSIGLMVSAIFVLIAVLLVFNAVRVAIYTRREEIYIMKLVGASNWYVRMPFLLVAVIYALFSMIIFLVLWYLFLWAAQPFMNTLWADQTFSLMKYFNSQAIRFFGLMLVGLIVLNVISAFVAVRRYVKV